MSVIDEVRREREELARVLKKHTGIRRIVEDLYPDTAHFIYELLQNADDTTATKATFCLTESKLVFEHNGKPFEAENVSAITDIGEGTKAHDDDKIGRFGVGFKAVFAYSETPHIWSPTYSFKITDLVLPSELPPATDIGGRTRFEFPFNNPKKPPSAAFAEVEWGLRTLAETTLLFLPHLACVSWQVGEKVTGQVLRVQHSEGHVEVISHREGRKTKGAHFLNFDRPVRGLEKQRVAVAYELDFLPNVQTFDAAIPIAKQLRLIPADPGRVSVYFPAEKETSGLRFHLHAPFVPELSRASIKNTSANLPLFDQLATLTATSLHRIRELGLLTTEFLEVLPHSRDPVAPRYETIREAIVSEMNEKPLTPTQSKTHAPARHLLKGKASLKSLLSDEDIEFLVDYETEPYLWAAGAAQKNSDADRFLDDLDIGKWDIEDFVSLLQCKTSDPPLDGKPLNVTPKEVLEWLHDKTVAWHQELYAFLATEHLANGGHLKNHLAKELGSLKIVRLADGSYGAGGESFFASEEAAHRQVLQMVDPLVYSSGRSRVQKDCSKAFLVEIGVREVGESQLVEAILARRYTLEAAVPADQTYKRDLKRFVALVEADPASAKLFEGYNIFKCVDKWRTPEKVYIDRPHKETGLDAYYHALGSRASRFALANEYQNCGVTVERLIKFAIAVGGVDRLAIIPTKCQANPDAGQLVWAAQGNWSSKYGINQDYHIPGLEPLLDREDLLLSRLVWQTLSELDDDKWAIAQFRNNSSCRTQTAPSQLAYSLKNHSWVPQADGRFVRPADAIREQLPNGFPFDPGWSWLEQLGFGEQADVQSAQQLQIRAVASELGFHDHESLLRAKRFAALPVAEQQRILLDWEHVQQIELPEREPSDPTFRAERVAEQAENAPERKSEVRPRAVSVGLADVKQEAGEYLRNQYTVGDGRMICQACRDSLPFRLDDGSDYFERVRLLPTLRRHHRQNYIALCPNHSAMFEHANGSTEQLADLVEGAVGNDVPVVLAQQDVALYFTKTHLVDLRAILSGERASEPPAAEPPEVG